MWSFSAVVAFLALRTVYGATEDLSIYLDNALSSGWENWSWSSDVNFAATDLISGTSGSSISVNSGQYAALSVKLEGTFPDYAGLRFDIAGAQPDLTITIQSTADNSQSPNILLSDISKTVVDGAFSSLLADFNALPGSGTQLVRCLVAFARSKLTSLLQGNGTWDRITFQAGGNGAVVGQENYLPKMSITVSNFMR